MGCCGVTLFGLWKCIHFRLLRLPPTILTTICLMLPHLAEAQARSEGCFQKKGPHDLMKVRP